MSNIKGVPDGWEVEHVSRFGEPGEHCVNPEGEPHLIVARTIYRVCIIRKIEQPARYRPFANAEEFKPHRDRWWYRDDNNVRRHFPPAGYSDQAHGGANWRHRFETCFFDDGTPFGVEVQ